MANQRRQGHSFERWTVKWFADKFNLIPATNKNFKVAEIGTSRQFSTALDALKIDIWFKPDLPDYIKIIQVQCKKMVSKAVSSLTINVKPLEEMPTGFNFLFTKVTKKVKSNEKAVNTYVTMDLDTFDKLMDSYIRDEEAKILSRNS